MEWSRSHYLGEHDSLLHWLTLAQDNFCMFNITKCSLLHLKKELVLLWIYRRTDRYQLLPPASTITAPSLARGQASSLLRAEVSPPHSLSVVILNLQDECLSVPDLFFWTTWLHFSLTDLLIKYLCFLFVGSFLAEQIFLINTKVSGWLSRIHCKTPAKCYVLGLSNSIYLLENQKEKRCTTEPFTFVCQWN